MTELNRGTDISTSQPDARCEHYLLRILLDDAALQQAYQTLLDSFQIPRGDRSTPRTILVTSTQPEEGKTTVTLMLALTAVMAGKRVLVIDTDLRRPRIHRLMKLDNRPGLGDVLGGAAEVKDVVRNVELSPEMILSVVTSGSFRDGTSPLSMGGARLAGLLAQSAEQFDLVLLDSAPVLAVTDPLFVAPLTDGVVLIVAVGVVGERDARQAKERIEDAGGKILGVVMNRFDEKLHGAGVHPYGSYYVDAGQRR